MCPSGLRLKHHQARIQCCCELPGLCELRVPGRMRREHSRQLCAGPSHLQGPRATRWAQLHTCCCLSAFTTQASWRRCRRRVQAPSRLRGQPAREQAEQGRLRAPLAREALRRQPHVLEPRPGALGSRCPAPRAAVAGHRTAGAHWAVGSWRLRVDRGCAQVHAHVTAEEVDAALAADASQGS